MSGKASYQGPALDGTYQSISEAPYWRGDGETVDVVDDTPQGEERTEGVPEVDRDDRPDDVDGQTTFDDWGWSA